MEIPDISIPDIYIPTVPEPYNPHYLQIAKPPNIDVPGCTYQHRDIKNLVIIIYIGRSKWCIYNV